MGFDLPHQRFDLAPEVAGSEFRAGEKAGDSVMADSIVQHGGQAGGGGLAKGGTEVVRVKVEAFLVHAGIIRETTECVSSAVK